jgi:hypothetical protein
VNRGNWESGVSLLLLRNDLQELESGINVLFVVEAPLGWQEGSAQVLRVTEGIMLVHVNGGSSSRRA